MPRVSRIGLVFGFGLDYCRDILRGIKGFAESRPDWSFATVAPEPRALEVFRSARVDGLIAHVANRALADAIERLGRPAVNVSGVLPELPFPRVMTDHREAGRLAARHLLDCGLRQFGFVGYPDHAFSIGREEGFREELAGAGFSASALRQRVPWRRDPTGLWSWNEALPLWLASLPRPVGILASHDPQGVQVSEACRQAGLKVPDDVAIVGVDDDDLLCELARPSLSSVALPSERIGREAAALLERLLDGAPPPAEPILLPPLGVVARQSSDILAIPDPEVAAAVRFIRDQGGRPLRVDDVLRAVPASRRGLERRFRKVLRRGIWEEIRRVQVDRGKALLSGTDLPMSEIARRAGFTDGRMLSVVFRQETGQTPTEFRRRHRGPR
ncbi:AraC family transcriptional regulator [Aquisphaera insulae]|uniref:AraC family transcriptional regulator n=1 Tax=Aquisphaera insulae TaxID=2712864 RepID=UPI0013ED4F91|nr:DNA-binding transcriptional regulator [Aquisphaera insulae]